MRRAGALAMVVLVAATISPARANAPSAPIPAVLQVLGSVTNAARPVANALVIALNVNSFEALQTYTTADGKFTLPPLRAGVYKIIAVKYGFLPATATVVPTRPDHRIALKLENEKRASRRDANQEIWEIRGSLPKDILRDLDNAMNPQTELAEFDVPRFRGEMVSMTAVTDQQSSAKPAFAQTALGVQSRLGSKLQLGIRGNLQRHADTSTAAMAGTPLAESSVMSMELRSSPTDAVRFASTKSWWIYRDDVPDTAPVQADVRAHNLEWEHGESRVQVRYLAQDNMFRQSATATNSEMFEIAGNTSLLQTRRNDVGVQLRVTQQSVDSATGALNTMRVADVAANGSFALVPAVMLHYGMNSRIALDAQEWAPSAGTSIKVGKNTSFIASALYKMSDEKTAASRVVPTIVVWTEDSRILPRYAYSFGFVTGGDENNRFSAIATVSELDAPFRVIFNDGFEQFWDGLYVESGDLRRDVKMAYRKQLGSFAIDVSTTAGTASQRDAEAQNKVYIVGDLQSTFTPTGTTLAISYREIQQPRGGTQPDYRTERVNVRMAQNLYLPIDMKLLLGVELARNDNSPYLLDNFVLDGTSKKYIGGLAFNF